VNFPLFHYTFPLPPAQTNHAISPVNFSLWNLCV